MPWLYRRNNSKCWWIGYRQNNTQILRSTGTADKQAAEKELAKVETMLAAQRAGALTVDLFQAISGKKLPSMTLKAALDDWLKETKASAGTKTLEKYDLAARALTDHFHVTETGPLAADVTREQLQQLLNTKRSAVSACTANMMRKCLSVFFRRCRAIGAVTQNPMDGIKSFKATREEARVRRPFKLAEISSIYKHAPTDFWRYMVLGGFFTGLRMGDLATMPIGAVDLKSRTISILTRKTGTTLHIPIAPALLALLKKLIAERKGAKPTDLFWPEMAERYERTGSGWFSQRFYDLMLVKAGLAGVRPHRKSSHAKKTSKRKVNEVSFHCFRHSFVSTLAALGQNQQIVKALSGHSSDELNDLYTKVPIESLKETIALLPDVTKEAK